MFSSLYRYEKEAVKAILSQRTFIINLSYKLKLDKNISTYTDKLPSIANKFYQLDRVDAYNFIQETNFVYDVLSTLSDVVIKYSRDNNLTGKELIEPCIAFPDFTGLRIMNLIGYLTLIKPIKDLIDFDEYLKNNTYLEWRQENCKKIQKDNLNPLSKRYSHFAKKGVYVDFENIAIKTQLETEFFETSFKPNLLTNIEFIIDKMKSSPVDTYSYFATLGVGFLDANVKNKKKQEEEFGKIFTSIVDGLLDKDTDSNN